MWPDWVLNPGPLPLESDALPTALRGLVVCVCVCACVRACVRACVSVCVYVCVREREREREREGVLIQSCLRWEILL